jgi:SNF2 family DNA or RNA helicase
VAAPILTRTDEALEVDLSPCQGSEFADAKLRVQSITGRRFDWDRKVWKLPPEPLVAEEVLDRLRPQADPEIIEWVQGARVEQAAEIASVLPEDAELQIPWAMKRADWQPHEIRVADQIVPFEGLMKHQRPVVDLAARVRRLLIADDMGLGKTGAALSAIEEFAIRQGHDAPTGPKLVICPNSVKGTWEREIRLWLPPSAQYTVVNASSASARHKQLAQGIERNDYIIVNWEQIRARREKVKTRTGGTKTQWRMKEPLFASTRWYAVIADEIHRAKNYKSQQARGLHRIQNVEGLMLGLSGTPIMNSPDELWSLLHWLWPKEYTSYWRFFNSYVQYYESERHRGKVITGVRNPDALRFELKDRIVRRTQDILDLPGKLRVSVPIELSKGQRKLYTEAENQLWVEVEQAAARGEFSPHEAEKVRNVLEGKASIIELPNGAQRTLRLRQIIETPANLGGEDDSGVLDACVDRIMDSRPEQWVVFCQFKPTVEALRARLEAKGINVAPYSGDVSPKDRKEIEERFQAGEIDVVVGTIDSLYQGITLTAGSKQFWVSRSWVPDINEQGEDRQHRIGQQNKVTILIAEPQDTVAVDKVKPTNQRKEKIVRAVLPKSEIEER